LKRPFGYPPKRLSGAHSLHHDLEHATKYSCRIYTEEDKMHALPERGKDDEYLAHAELLHMSGHLIAGEALKSVQTATIMRVRAASCPSPTAPFAATKALICGPWMGRCKSMEQTIEWVTRCPP